MSGEIEAPVKEYPPIQELNKIVITRLRINFFKLVLILII